MVHIQFFSSDKQQKYGIMSSRVRYQIPGIQTILKDKKRKYIQNTHSKEFLVKLNNKKIVKEKGFSNE